MKDEMIIYEEDENGVVIYSELEDYMRVPGVWTLYGRNKTTKKFECLNVGKTKDVGGEILYDIGILHFLKIRDDGEKNYISQTGHNCKFMYNSAQTREYLYPIIASRYDSFKFIYIYKDACAKIEKEYAFKNNSIFWRNGRPYGGKSKSR